MPQKLLPYLLFFLTHRVMSLVTNEKGQAPSNSPSDCTWSLSMCEPYQVVLGGEAKQTDPAMK